MRRNYSNFDEVREIVRPRNALSQRDVEEQIYGNRSWVDENNGYRRDGQTRNEQRNETDRQNNRDRYPRQQHTHEYLGSVKIAEAQEDPHNHRFAGVTGEAIPISGGSHFHKLEDNTDFYEDHFHIVADRTGPAIPVGNNRHVHFVEGQTSVNDGHRHKFQFATLINDPIGD